MSLFAMSDLHLSHFKEKPMDVFDIRWRDHTKKIYERWNETVSEEDTVIVNGDISWGGRLEEAMPDLDFIHGLKGKKILFCGNHDFFWNSTSRLNELYDDMLFVKNSFAAYKDYAICGSRGWLCPRDEYYTDHDSKIYKREAGRLRNSISMAVNKGYDSDSIIAVTHFPPTNDKKENSDFVDIYKEFNIKRVIYGHLHGEDKYGTSYQGIVDGIDYTLVSADYLDFRPAKIL